MCFLNVKVCFLLLLGVSQVWHMGKSQHQSGNSNSNLNFTIFKFQNVNACRRNEYYDLDNFVCVSCNDVDDGNGNKLQPNADKLSCKCSDNTISEYDSSKRMPTCKNICTVPNPKLTNSAEDFPHAAQNECEARQLAAMHCNLKYINSSMDSAPTGSNSRTIYISPLSTDDKCNRCEALYNFRYQDYCIANALLRPYLNFNAFWQASTNSNSHFGELKFVAFFCLALHNVTACNQLANLCVLSHYSHDKNSPCSPFLLTQVSDVVIRYGNMRDQLRAVRPFLFYKKGKSAVELLGSPIEGLQYKLEQKSAKEAEKRLQFFGLNFALDGTLKFWGTHNLAQMNLCARFSSTMTNLILQNGIVFAKNYANIECQLSLENLIDLARINGNDNFFNIYLNLTLKNDIYLQQLPILIETLTPENQLSQMEDWQLVKRFQLFETHPKYRSHAQHSTLNYGNNDKLQIYRSLRYVEKFVLHYEIHNGNRIGLPLIRLRYRQIEINAKNSTLDQLYPFRMQITFAKIDEAAKRQLLGETMLPLLLLLALGIALLRANNTRRRRNIIEICDIACFFEFIYQLISNVAHALLIAALLLIGFNSIEYLTQHTVRITLPLIKHQQALNSLIYFAFILKLIFVFIKLWRISHIELFLIDWERPKSCDNNHFNLKSNLETSSVCSSVRTYVAEYNVSAWRILFAANEWIRLSCMQKHSTIVQSFVTLIVYNFFDSVDHAQKDITLNCFKLSLIYVISYTMQLFVRTFLLNRMFGDPMHKFTDLCSLANVSVFTLLDHDYGFYIHGRSPHGFADTDMSSMIMQLQREAQSICGRRGLLSDSDKQAYIILPPKNLRNYLERLLIPFQRSCSLTQSHYQKDMHTSEGHAERTTIAYTSVNRFFCAFIDHAIKDMDYIIKEKSFLERLLDCEIDNYLTENKGTFYIDNSYEFGRLFLIGNNLHLFILELLLLLTIFLLTCNLFLSVALTCLFNIILQNLMRFWVRRNVSAKTLIDQRFLM